MDESMGRQCSDADILQENNDQHNNRGSGLRVAPFECSNAKKVNGSRQTPPINTTAIYSYRTLRPSSPISIASCYQCQSQMPSLYPSRLLKIEVRRPESQTVVSFAEKLVTLSSSHSGLRFSIFTT